MPYTLLRRTLPSGKTVFYYRTYDKEGRRTTARTTGRSTRTAAHAFVHELVKAGRLQPDRRIRFCEYARDWWIWGKCLYLSRKIDRGGKVTHRYADECRAKLKKHILPRFGARYLSDVTTLDVDRWVETLRSAGLAASTVNQTLSVLSVMLKEAVRRGLLLDNPAAPIQRLSVDPSRRRGILSPDEAWEVLSPGALSVL